MGGSVAYVKLFEAGYPLEVAALYRIIFIPLKLLVPILVFRLVDKEKPLHTVVKFILPTYVVLSVQSDKTQIWHLT